MNRKNQILCVAVTVFLASCASTHNLNNGSSNLLGGGYLVDEVEPGKFRIIATTNWAPWPNYSGARGMWEKEANKACAGKSYSESNVTERDYESLPSPFPLAKYIVTEKDGYAVCEISVSNKTN